MDKRLAFEISQSNEVLKIFRIFSGSLRRRTFNFERKYTKPSEDLVAYENFFN